MRRFTEPAGHLPGSAGQILHILRDGVARSKRELSLLTGQSRTAIAPRLALLCRAGLVHEAGEPVSTGGRPSAHFTFNGTSKLILAVDLGANHAAYGITDLTGALLAHSSDPVSISAGPEVVMALVLQRLDQLLGSAGIPPHPVAAIGIGLPGPVEKDSGRPTSPPIMPGWDQYDVRAALAERYACPVFVDNDANILAIGEHDLAWPEVDDLIYVKVATGIGAGVISGGRVLHGAEGAAGDLGHVHCVSAGDRPCRCGNRGCLESLAGGMSIAAILTEQGIPATSPADVVDLVRAGNIQAVVALREAGRALGEVLATCIALFNPRVIVIGGEIVAVGEPLLAGVRETVYSRALPLASRDLRVAVAQSGNTGGIIGASRLAIENLLAPTHFETLLRDDQPVAS